MIRTRARAELLELVRDELARRYRRGRAECLERLLCAAMQGGAPLGTAQSMAATALDQIEWERRGGPPTKTETPSRLDVHAIVGDLRTIDLVVSEMRNEGRSRADVARLKGIEATIASIRSRLLVLK